MFRTFCCPGLRKLEYRGYDSSGVALLGGEGLQRVRVAGRVADLEQALATEGARGCAGIAHTRWATHGAATRDNAHPHRSGGVAVVHNGIVENHTALRADLEGLGYVFASETDTEVVVHLIEACHSGVYGGDAVGLPQAVQRAVGYLQGAFALAVVHEDEPDAVMLVRQGSPLLVGVGEEGMYAASDAAALISATRRLM